MKEKVDKRKIGLVTTVSNWELYHKTRPFFPEGIKIFAVDGTRGFFGINSLLFFIEKLKKYELDWIIMADEDVIFSDANKVFDLIDHLNLNHISIAGMRDGGMLNWRFKNPFSINHFFAVLNLKEIFEIYDRREILANQFIEPNEFDMEDLKNLPYKNYNVTCLEEPYYCFYFWLRRKGKKFLFLEGVNSIEGDFATTVLKDHNSKDFLYHTWFARFYKREVIHTKRIENILNSVGKIPEGCSQDYILLKNPLFNIRFFFYKYYRRIRRYH